MTSEEAIAWIHGRKTFGMRPGLMRVEALLQRLGNPEKNLTLIHVAGTKRQGFDCQLFTKSSRRKWAASWNVSHRPHIESFNERIEIDGRFYTR